MAVSLFAALYCTGILDKFVRHTINHVDKHYAFPSHFWLNTCSARDNYAHARTVDTRLFLSAHQEPGYEASLGRAMVASFLSTSGRLRQPSLTPNVLYVIRKYAKIPQ